MKLIHRAMDANAQDQQNPIYRSLFMPQQAVPVSAGFGNHNNFGGGRFEMAESNIRHELEKQRIREEIIAEEMIRRRVLEAEVRNELMMEREMAMRPIGLEEKLGKPDCETLSGTKRKSTPESKPDDDETLSGTKRKSTPPVSISDGSNKRVKEEWACAVCQISTTSEQGLTQHLQGKKHQTKEAALLAQRTGANVGLGAAPTKAIIKPLQLALTTVTVAVSSNETNKPSTDVTKKDMQLAFKPSSSKPNKPSSPNDIRSGKNKRDKFKFWCEMCQVGAFSETVMNDHKQGKKHSARLVKFYRKGEVDLEASVTTENSCDQMKPGSGTCC